MHGSARRTTTPATRVIAAFSTQPAGGQERLRMNVAAILKAKGSAVETAGPDITLMEAAQRMAARRIGAIVIIDRPGHVVGIVSERDIVREIAAHGAEASDRPVSSTMTHDVIVCRRDDTIEYLMEQMTARRFRHLPVMEDDALIGIVSIGDVVKHHIAEVEMEKSALRDYIASG
jgi:CBS domain-containing protein